MFRRSLLFSSLALVACVSHTEESELTGRASMAIADVPSNVSCIQVSAATSSRTATDSFDVTAGQSTVLELSGIPTGAVTFTGSAFASACSAVTPSSTPNWTGAPVTAVIAATTVTPVTLVLTPNGQTAVTIDFEGDAGGSAAPTCSSPSTCTATVASNAIPLSCGYAAASLPGGVTPGGYTFAFSDSGGSTACVDATAFCASGISAAANATFTNFGGGIGVNLDQQSAPPSTVNSVSLAGTQGVSYALSNLPPGARIAVESGGTQFCSNLTSASGTVPWGSFNTKCFDSPPDGVALTPASALATSIQFEVPSATTAQTWSFCVTALTFSM
jgi:hypothetical protein